MPETPSQGSPHVAEPAAAPARTSLKRRITRPSHLVDLTEGSAVGEYEIQGLLGEGAMGTVYAGIHPLIGKRVAIKVLKPELCANQTTLDRFVQEAQAVNQIGHPNIVDVFSLGELPDGRAYFVMEWLRGEDLKARVSRGPMAVLDACDILDGISRALEAAHAKSIVHRDLKPDNVFLQQVDNGPLIVKLLDFGIAKLMRSAVPKEKTQTGNMLGTPRYISPEQARGIDVDHRADIYSLGVIAYEMLAGRPPFDAPDATAMDLVIMHINEAPPPLGQFAKVPRPLEATIMRMLAKEPAQRPTLTEIRAVFTDPQRRLTPVPSKLLSVPQPPSNPRRWWIALAGICALGLGLATWKLLAGGTTAESAAPVVVVQQPPAPSPPLPVADPPAKPVVVEPARSKLAIDVEGATNAEIKVDGERWARGSSANGETTAGKHEITVIAGKDIVRQEVDVAAGETSTVKIVVKRVGTVRPARPADHKTATPPPKTNDDDLILKPKSR